MKTLFFLLLAFLPASKPSYELREVRGWRVHLDSSLLDDDPVLVSRAMAELDHQLFQVERALPAAALPLLRKVDIWIEDGSQARGMCFHPSADWLRAHGKDPAKAGCVEISDPRDFLDWVGHQQWMVLHEMAHAWHFRVLETRHPKESETLRKAYQHARQSGIYQRVLYWDGHRERSYAMQDEHEYFAELSEAWFGCNDIYPFVRAELLELDPVGAAAVKAAWEVKEP